MDELLERWLAELVATPGLTAVTGLAEARRLHVDDALAALPLLREDPVVDVGSGGGSPGIPLARARPELAFVLLEASRRKCEFLERWADELPNVSVVCARAEEHGRFEGRDAYGTALARALAPPPVALEWSLPLLRPGGRVVLYAGEIDAAPAAAAAERLAARVAGLLPAVGSERRSLLVVEKLGPTPDGFPRRPGVARKRPLA
ncbi:MAG: class I SAM-dependent methyltransferase [Thermoleophilia bacterium]|nr:class I SAM-dependent methyltransferase [Thermoleophilia bacterium]